MGLNTSLHKNQRNKKKTFIYYKYSWFNVKTEWETLNTNYVKN